MGEPAKQMTAGAHHYQVLLLGPGAAGEEALQQILIQRGEELGLSVGELVVLKAETYSLRDSKAPLATVYIAGPGQDEVSDAITAMIVRDGLPVLPLVSTLDDYKVQVPWCLCGINTRPYSPTDEYRAQVASWVMEELGLQRQHRQIFLSYRRKESISIAQQIYHALDERSFHVFLDTHSIPSGRLFDPWIHNWIAEAEVLILLGTQTVFDSRWVEREFTRASALGVGVLYLVWPEAPVPPAAELAMKHYLRVTDFDLAPTEPGAKLSDTAILEVIGKAETLRARSFAARQARIVGALCRKIEARGLPFLRTWQRYVEITRPEGRGRRVYPVVGRPDTTLMEIVHRVCEPEGRDACLLYDDQGILPEIRQHLDWLNRFAPIQVFSMQQADEWIVKP